MKKCNHCGAPIKGGGAAFCPKCKKPLKKASKKKLPDPTKPKQPPLKSIPQAKKVPPPKLKIPKKKLMKNIIFRLPVWLSAILKPKTKKNPEIEQTPAINPMDENYDGYYDDKPTDDNAQNKETLAVSVTPLSISFARYSDKSRGR